MTIACPNCAAPGQEIGKFCENCGFFIATADSKPEPPPQSTAAPSPSSDPAAPTTSAAPPAQQATSSPAPAADIDDVITNATGILPPPGPNNPAPPGSAHFALVTAGKADPTQGFVIARMGEYLVGRTDMESGNQADIDVRRWVQPMDIHGQKQYLIHRKQCYLALTNDGAVTIRPIAGYERDTLVRPAGGANFVPLETLGTVRNARPDSSFPLEPGDHIFMGDPDALPFYLQGNPTASGSYLVLELLPRT